MEWYVSHTLLCYKFGMQSNVVNLVSDVCEQIPPTSIPVIVREYRREHLLL